MSDHTPSYTHAAYLSDLFPTSKLRVAIARAVKILRQIEFDAVAWRGMSGALVGPPIALRLNKPMLMVRKKVDGVCHSPYEVEGDKAARTYVIVDDFVGSGYTARAIMAAVRKFAPEAQCLGVLEVNRLMDDNYHWEHLKHVTETVTV